MSKANQQASTERAVDERDEYIEFLHDKLVEVETTCEALADRVGELESTVAAKDERIADLERRMDLLQLLEAGSDATPEQRQAQLLQHLVNKAERKGENGRRYTAAIDRDQAEEALHHTVDIHRTTFYNDLDRIRQKIGDGEICYWDKSTTPKRLVLDLEAYGDVPADPSHLHRSE